MLSRPQGVARVPGHKHGIGASQKNGELAQWIVLVKISAGCHSHCDTSNPHLSSVSKTTLSYFKIIKQKNLCINTNPRPTNPSRKLVAFSCSESCQQIEAIRIMDALLNYPNYPIPHACQMNDCHIFQEDMNPKQ